MRFFKITSILLFSSIISLYGCKDSAEQQQQQRKAQDPQPIDFSNPATQTTSEPSQNTAGVWHYTCSNGCAGGSGSAGTCASCGNTLAHNSAYHSNTNNAATTNPLNSPVPAETGQNSAGVWHYSCDNGCAGGSASAGSCSNCGATLAHNSAYHQ